MQLTKEHLGLIEWQLSTFEVTKNVEDDLRSAGNMGLLRAVRTYPEDEQNTAKFETYATNCIRNAMVDELRSLNANKNKVMQLAPSEIVEEQALDPETPESLLLEKETWDEGWNRLMDILPELSYRQEFILMHRIYCNDEDELTQAEIASRFKCNQSTIQREERRLYAYLKDAGQDYIRNDS